MVIQIELMQKINTGIRLEKNGEAGFKVELPKSIADPHKKL